MRKSDLWKRISELDQDSTTLCEGTCMLLLRHRSDEGNEYKILEYNGQDGTFYNPFTEAEECVNTRQSRVDYLNLDRL